ncbi:MAG: F0F1 ATP synthase subunit delta [Thiotrichaceae bacterium]
MSELTTTARPYAKAVFELANDAGKLTEWSDELAFLGTVVSHDDVRALLDNPNMTGSVAANAVIEISGDHLDDGGKNLVKQLAEFDRLEVLPEISVLFEALKDEAEDVVEAVVTSAQELSDDEKKSIATALKKRLGRDVKITEIIDESIMGGAIIRAGDLVIDGSIQGRLKNITHALVG